MNIFDKALEVIGLTRKSQQIPMASAIGGGDPFLVWGNNKKERIDRAMSIYNSWVYACVRAISEEMAKMKFRLFQVNKQKVHEEIFEHELLDLLDGANPFQTGYELRYLMASHLELAGNAYWLLDGVKNETDKPTGIYLLNPKYIEVIKAPLPEFIRGYKYRVDNNERTLQPYEVLHLKYPDPNDPYEGIGTVQAIIDWVTADNFASEVNLNYFKNGARLGGLLKSANAITDAQMKVLRRSFEEMYKGAGNSYRVAVLPKGVEFEDPNQNPKDMDFANLQAVMRDKILSGFRVSKTILGTAESETNRATAETADYIFAARTMKPKMEMIVQYLNEFLVPRYGDNLYLDFESVVPDDKLVRIEEMKAATGGQPIMSVNEARETYFGLDGIESGDAVLTDFTKTPLGAPKPKEVAKFGSKHSKMPSKKLSSKTKKRRDISDEISKKLVDSLAKQKVFETGVIKKAIKNITELTDEEYEVLYKAWSARVGQYEKLMTEKIRKVNADQKDEVMGKLSGITAKKLKKKGVNPDDIFDTEEWNKIIIDLTDPVMADMFEKEAKEAAKLVGFDGFAMTPEAKKAIKRAMELMADSYNQTTRDALKKVLDESINEGLSLPDIEGKVSDIYAFSNATRAEAVARTETYRIANDSKREAWKQSGVVRTIKWYTAADENVCEWCAPMNGKIVGIEENFFDKGDVVTGSNGEKMSLDYAAVTGGALHVNCRCDTRPDEISAADEGKTANEGTKKEDVDIDEVLNEAIKEVEQENG